MDDFTCKQDILGVRFDGLTLPRAVEAACQLLARPGFDYAVTPNAEFLLSAQRDASFRALLGGASLTLPDGVGVVLAGRILGTPVPGRVAGIDFADALLARLAGTDTRVFLLGAGPGAAEQAAARLTTRHPGLTICGTCHGYFSHSESEAVAQTIRDAGTDLLLVCLGSPRQEEWMARFGPLTGAKLAIGLGGALDVWSGRVPRAPLSWQRLGLEWAWRLLRQPQRIRRVLPLPLVLLRAARARLRLIFHQEKE